MTIPWSIFNPIGAAILRVADSLALIVRGNRITLEDYYRLKHELLVNLEHARATPEQKEVALAEFERMIAGYGFDVKAEAIKAGKIVTEQVIKPITSSLFWLAGIAVVVLVLIYAPRRGA